MGKFSNVKHWYQDILIFSISQNFQSPFYAKFPHGISTCLVNLCKRFGNIGQTNFLPLPAGIGSCLLVWHGTGPCQNCSFILQKGNTCYAELVLLLFMFLVQVMLNNNQLKHGHVYMCIWVGVHEWIGVSVCMLVGVYTSYMNDGVA